MPRKAWFSVGELGGLPGLPTSERGVSLKAKREKWKSRPRKGRGGGQEYHIGALPDETRAALFVATATLPRVDTELDLELEGAPVSAMLMEIRDYLKGQAHATATLEECERLLGWAGVLNQLVQGKR